MNDQNLLSLPMKLHTIKNIIDQDKSRCAPDHDGDIYRTALDNVWNLIEAEALRGIKQE